MYRIIYKQNKGDGHYCVFISPTDLKSLITKFFRQIFCIYFASIHGWLRFLHDVVIFIPEQ